MQCYFDGSEGHDDTGSRWLTLVDTWPPIRSGAGFEMTGTGMLRERYPSPHIST